MEQVDSVRTKAGPEEKQVDDDDDESPFIHDSIQKLFTPWCRYAYSQPP